tara:strand:+ start:1172 stop:2488 length:1317 start_codon:yes stop_codon:yes gene_type:complete
MDSDGQAYYFGRMLIANFLSDLSGLSPQARYALMKLWLENGHSLPVQMSVENCASHMAIPRARAGKVINELIDTGHIEPDYRIGQRGRPKRFINISAATTEMLRNLTPTHPGGVLHLESVHSLLAHRTSDADADSSSLSPANIVFLIALLSCANECGAVNGLGTSKLITYTGMTAQRINLQVKKMRKLGIILFSVPGMTGARILGKTTTTYWLDLTHPLFILPTGSKLVKKVFVNLGSGAKANAMFDITHQMTVIQRKHWKTLKKSLNNQQAFDLAITKLDVQVIAQIPSFDISSVECFFREAANFNLRLSFQLVVDRVARSIALARIRTSSNSNQIAPTFSMLRTLYRELLPRRFLSPGSETAPSKKSRRMLVRVVLEIANTLATEIAAELRGNRFKLSSVTSFELAPISKVSTDRLLVVALNAPDPPSTEKEKTAD